MTDYRQLSKWKKLKVDKEIVDEIEPKHHKNPNNEFEWNNIKYIV